MGGFCLERAPREVLNLDKCGVILRTDVRSAAMAREAAPAFSPRLTEKNIHYLTAIPSGAVAFLVSRSL